jgi:hypothetical protein
MRYHSIAGRMVKIETSLPFEQHMEKRASIYTAGERV